MAAGDTTRGVRLPDGTGFDSAPTPATYWMRGEQLWVTLPNGVGPCRLDGWTVTVHDDETITAAPSILDRGPSGWHGYLERGQWREV
jgi:hypothetical protein